MAAFPGGRRRGHAGRQSGRFGDPRLNHGLANAAGTVQPIPREAMAPQATSNHAARLYDIKSEWTESLLALSLAFQATASVWGRHRVNRPLRS